MSFCFLFLLLTLSGLVDFSSSLFFTWSISFCLTLNISINSFITSFSNSNLLIYLTILLCLSHCFLVCSYCLHLRLRLVRVKVFPENRYFPEMLFSGKENVFMCLVAFQKNFRKIFSDVWLYS